MGLCWSIAEFFSHHSPHRYLLRHILQFLDVLVKDDKNDKGKPFPPPTCRPPSSVGQAFCTIQLLHSSSISRYCSWFFSRTLAETWSSLSLLYFCPPSSSIQQWMLREVWSRKRWTITHFILYHLIWIWGHLPVRFNTMTIPPTMSCWGLISFTVCDRQYCRSVTSDADQNGGWFEG